MGYDDGKNTSDKVDQVSFAKKKKRNLYYKV